MRKFSFSIGMWILIVFFSMLCLFIVAISWWWSLFETPTTTPSQVKAVYIGKNKGGLPVYKVVWKNNDNWPCKYTYTLSDSETSQIIDSSTFITGDSEFVLPPLLKGSYILTLTASAQTPLSSKTPSKSVTIPIIPSYV